MNIAFPQNVDHVIIGNVGDEFPADREIDQSTQHLCRVVSLRGTGLAGEGKAVLVPADVVGIDFIEYLAKSKYPRSLEKQEQWKNNSIIRLALQDTTASDFERAIHDANLTDSIRGKKVSPYVRKKSIWGMMENLELQPADFTQHIFAASLGDKCNFFRFCQKLSLESPPYSQALGEGDNKLPQDRVDEILQNIHNIFNTTDFNSIIIRKAVSGGGEGNAIIKKIEMGAYVIIYRDKKIEISNKEGLKNWLLKIYAPQAGVMLAPYLEKANNISTVIIIQQNGEISMPYIANEETIDGKYVGCEVDPNKIDEWIKEEVKRIMTKMGKSLHEKGYHGSFQCDLVVDKEKKKVYPTENNACRDTAVSQSARLHAGGRADWAQYLEKQLDDSTFRPFTSVDHLLTEKLLSIHEITRRLQNITKSMVQSVIQATPSRDIDLNQCVQIIIPPHERNKAPAVGLLLTEYENGTKLSLRVVRKLVEMVLNS